MIIIPREKPVIENLNSYYLDIRKLFEHYQGEIGSGGIHFKSPSAEGVIFFDKDELLSGIFKDKEREIKGKGAIERLIEMADDMNFTINVYSIDLEKVYFWANIPAAKDIYKDLSTDFTDLEGLIRKMGSEKLTGYIDVSISDGKEGGLIFFINGEIIGGSYSWGKGEVNGSKETQDIIIQKTKESGGIFHVSRIPLPKGEVESESKEASQEISSDVLTYLEELLGIFERTLASNKEIKINFDTLLKKKFMEKADKYTFLDPFAAEFEYSARKISYAGDASDEDLISGVIEAVKELADELGILPQLRSELAPWSQKYANELARFGISF